MNICFISLDYPSAFSGGGVGTQMQDIARALVKAGHQVTVVDLLKDALPEFENDNGVMIRRVQVGNIHWYVKKIPFIGAYFSSALRELEYGKAVHELIKQLHAKTSFDLIEGTETGALGVTLGLKSIPLIIRLHGEIHTVDKHIPGSKVKFAVRLLRYVQRIALRRAQLLIAVSSIHGQEIAEELNGRHPQIEVLPNFIDLNRSSSAGHKKDTATVLYVGRIEQRKGVPLLLRAAARVLRECPDANFVLAGAYHPTLSQTEIEKLIREYKLEGHVSFPGHIPLEQLTEWYARATLCVLPSYYESFGISALEAMASGVPIVATRAGGLTEVIEDGITGILTPVGDEEALAEAMIRLLKNPELCRTLGEAGKRHAREKFDPKILVAKNIEIYKRLIHTSPKVFEETRHIFFSPHFDDSVFSCGGLMDALVKEGKSVKVITVFSGGMLNGTCSAFGRHLLAKWELGKEFQNERLAEDKEALSVLRIEETEYWGIADAPYRHDSGGTALYGSFEELKGCLHREDRDLVKKLLLKAEELTKREPVGTVFYFPLSFNAHVDHRILFSLGLQTMALGHKVRFYEDWPYAEEHDFYNHPEGWISQNIDIHIERKVEAILKYKSQIKGLAESPGKVSQRTKLFLFANGHKQPQERYWQLIPEVARKTFKEVDAVQISFSKKKAQYFFRDFLDFLTVFRWHDLGEILPSGQGICLDVGCGTGRHRKTIEKRGYRWKGLDQKPPAGNAQAVQGDIQFLPIQSGTLAAITAWQVMEYVEELDSVLAEAERTLEVGGVFCGSVSFLEPLHGKSFYGMSPAILEKLLKKYGFVDIRLKPGLCGFSLMLWTWFRRMGGDGLARLALPLSAVCLVPLAAVRFLISWLGWRLGLGSAHGMDWIVHKAPLEFAGHIMFAARKPARSQNCISAS